MSYSVFDVRCTRACVITGLATLVLASTADCVVTNQGNCLYQGGDAWCRRGDLGNICIAPVDGSLEGSRVDGCHDALTAELEAHAHVKYGLVQVVFNQEAGRDPGEVYFGSLEGHAEALVQLGELEAGCEIPFASGQPLVDDAVALRAELDPPGTRVDNRKSFLTAAQRVRFTEMNDGLDELFAPCLVDGGTETDGSGTETETGGETDESTGTTGTTGPMPCVIDDECADVDPAAPFCNPVGECVSCDGVGDPDAACAGADAMTPLCVADTCVACTADATTVCDDQLLLCDVDANTCTPCTEHGQCGSGACELAVGRCFPSDFVVRVDDATAMPAPDFTTIQDAVDAIVAMGQGVVIVHELNGGASYQGGVEIDGGKTVALLAANGEAPIVQGTGMNPGVRVQGAGTVAYIDGLTFAGNTAGLGIVVDGSLVWVDRGQISQNSGGGVSVDGGAEFTLRNSFVGLNGGQFADTRGLTATDGTITVVYSSIAANDGDGSTGPVSMACGASVAGEVRNSIVASGDDTIGCSTITFNNNVVDTAGLDGMNNTVASFNPAWFPGIAMGDLHVLPGAPFVDVAEWSAGDPGTDIDGDPRPTEDGAPDYCGADVP